MRKAGNLPASCAVVTKSGNLNFLEPSGPVQACNGTALPLPLNHHCCSVTVAVMPAAALHYKLPDFPKWVVLNTGL